jgi:hypothetical protein
MKFYLLLINIFTLLNIVTYKYLYVYVRGSYWKSW